MLAVLLLLAQQDRTTWSFDDGAGAWRQVTYSGQAAFGAADGALTISSQNGADASWSFDAPVRPDSFYRVSARVRTEGVSGAIGALINVHQVPGSLSRAATGDSGWTQVSFQFRSGRRTSVQINCLFGGWGQSRGRAYYDDVVLERIDMLDYPGPVTIDMTQEREPISPYIYGQFIEHLGRCIYGGIWAEMLEDRKFYFPIEGKEPYQRMREGYDRLVASPWVLTEGSTATRFSDVYRDQPAISLDGTIEQRRLSTIAGKEYVVRIVFWGAYATVGFREGGSVTTRPIPLGHMVEWKSQSLTLRAEQSTDNATFYVNADAGIAAVSLMPADNIDGFRRDVIELLKQLGAPIYRWPGGNFVSGYEWRDGIGDPDARPTIPNPAWTGIDTNDVGIHEFIRFCELVGSEPLIVVNTGFGGPQAAADELEYCNGAHFTPMGALRAANGCKEPFNVRWWGIGNEMYGSWQLGHIPVAQYVTKHNMTVDRMKAVDPTIKTIAVGETGPWDEAMLRNTRHNMDLLSEHIYVQSRADTVEHTRLLPEAIRRKADWHRRFQPSLSQPFVRISMDEWNYWYGPYLYGELGTRYYWKDGLGVAAGLHEFFRNTDVYEMAQYAQTVNVIGAIKTTATAAEFETTGLVLMMYRKHFGTIPVAVSGVNPDLGLDIVAALTADRKTLTIAVVNPFDREVTVPIEPFPLPGFGLGRGGGLLHTIQSDDPMAYNEPGKPRRISIKQTPWAGTNRLTVPRHSVTIARVIVALD